MQLISLGPAYSPGVRDFPREVKFRGQPFWDSFLGFFELLEESLYLEFHNFLSRGTTPKSSSIPAVETVLAAAAATSGVTQSLREQPLSARF